MGDDSTLAGITLALEQAHREAKAEELRHTEASARIAANRQRLYERQSCFMAGLDLAQIELARTVIYVRGSYSKAGNWRHQRGAPFERDTVLQDAALDLANGAKRLRTEYFGTKVYEGYVGQREDHRYGFGPRHGSTNFAIGLQPDARKRPLTEAEINAAIYFIGKLAEIEAAEASRQAA